MLVSHTQLLLQLNHVALEKTNDCCTWHSLQPVTCFPDGPLQLRISGVCFQALPRCVHRISRSLQLSFRLGVSTPTLSWPPSFLVRDHQFSRPHDGCGADFTSSALLSPSGFALRCLPTAVATSCRSRGSVTRRLRSTGGLAETLSRRFRAKRPRSLTGADTRLWSEIGRKEGWGCTVTFRMSLRSRCLVRM